MSSSNFDKFRGRADQRRGRGRLFSCLLIALLFLTACVRTGTPITAEPPGSIQWPQVPFPARIEWVKTIADDQAAGIGKGFWKKVADFFTGAEKRHIVRPHGVLFDDSERLFIADPGAGLVHCMEMKEGRYTLIGREAGSSLRSPIGLAEDELGRLYISDSTTGMVYVYDLVRRSLRPLLRQKLQRPTGIAYSRVTKLLYIVDTTIAQVIAVDATGEERLRFGAPGEGMVQFNHPTDIAVDGRGRLYVTDPLNYRIKVFSSEGRLLNELGAAGDTLGSLNKPKGVAVDSDGHIYVSDALLDAVQMFDGSGRLLLSFGMTGTGNGQFWMPSGIYIDRRDYIFVADTYNRRVQVFRYLSDARPADRKTLPPIGKGVPNGGPKGQGGISQ